MRNPHRRLVRTTAIAVVSALLAPAVGLALPQVEQEQLRTLELSLQDAVELALRHNLQVRLTSLNPDLQEEQIRNARSFFDPVLQFNLPQTFNRSTSPSSSQLGGADVLTNEFISSGFQIRSNTSFGTFWSFSGNGSRQVTNNAFSTFNPQFNTSLQLQVQQPLLNGFGTAANKRNLLVAQNDFSVSREVFSQQLQGTIFQVVQGYWQLVFQLRNVEIQERGVQLAEEQLRDNRTRARIGVLAESTVVQAEQQVAEAALNLIQATNNLEAQEDALKRLLNLDAFVPEGWNVELVPTDDPLTDYDEIDVEAAVLEALQKNPQIRQDRINRTSRQLDVRAASNGLLPQVNLVGQATVSGLGGDQIFRTGAFGGDVSEIQEGGLSQSFNQLFSGDFRNWSVGLQVIFPVRNDAARAAYAQASIRERQAATQMADTELGIRLQVRNAIRGVEGGIEQVAAAQAARDLAERQYSNELRRFEAGISSTFQVLSFQRQLSASEARELFAVIGLNQSIAAFELSRGTILETFGISIDEAGTGGPMMPTQTPVQDAPAAVAATSTAAGSGSRR